MQIHPAHGAPDRTADVELRLQPLKLQHRARMVRGLGRHASQDRRARHRATKRPGLQPRVQNVADAVAQKVDPHHQHEDREPGYHRDMRMGEQHLAPLPQHGPEIGLRRLRAQPEERQPGRFQDHPAHGGGHGDDDDRQHVRQHLGQHDPRVALARQPRGIDEFAPRQAQRDPADVAREERHVDDGDGIERVEQPRPQHRDDGEREQDVGKGHDHVDAAHQPVVHAPARIARHQPDERSEERGDQRGRQAHGDGHPRAPDQPGQQVPPQRVGAQRCPACPAAAAGSRAPSRWDRPAAGSGRQGRSGRPPRPRPAPRPPVGCAPAATTPRRALSGAVRAAATAISAAAGRAASAPRRPEG